MSQPKYHLCHLNIGTSQAPLTDPVMEGFVTNLERINELASKSPGFVWHFEIDVLGPEYTKMYNEPGMIFNLSVWESVEALHDYVYQSEHVNMMKFRKQWFADIQGPRYVLWWQPGGVLPTLEEGKNRLQYFADHGPTPYAFAFKQPFAPLQDPAEESAGTMELIYRPTAPIVSELDPKGQRITKAS